MNTYQVQSVLHSEITEPLLTRIAFLKDTVWPNGINEQKQYMLRICNPNDCHCFIESMGNMVGYVCIKSARVTENKIEIPALGVAGLCTSPSIQGKGVSSTLLTHFMNQCKKNNLPGILFCKEKVREFYQKHGWTAYPILVNGKLFNHYFMVFNFSDNTQRTFEFHGELF